MARGKHEVTTNSGIDEVERFASKRGLDPAVGLAGAYVQSPNTDISSFFINQTITTILDFSSLYPTIIVWLNLHYLTIVHRFFNQGSVDQLLKTLQDYEKKKSERFKNQIVDIFVKEIVSKYRKQMTDVKKDKKAERLEFIEKTYRLRFHRILTAINKYGFDRLMYNHDTDLLYQIFTNDVMTLMEAVHTIKLPSMFHVTAIDLITRHEEFVDEYGGRTIWYIADVHTRKRKLASMPARDFYKFSDDYIVSPFGALVDKHEVNLPLDISDLSFGLLNRGTIKNTGLTESAMATVMDNAGIDELDNGSFETVRDQVDAKIQKIIELQYDQILADLVGVVREQMFTNSGTNLNLSDALKVINNSTYGLLGTATNPYGSFIVSNSITSAAKVLGLLALQYQCNINFSDPSTYVIVDEEDKWENNPNNLKITKE